MDILEVSNALNQVQHDQQGEGFMEREKAYAIAKVITKAHKELAELYTKEWPDPNEAAQMMASHLGLFHLLYGWDQSKQIRPGAEATFAEFLACSMSPVLGGDDETLWDYFSDDVGDRLSDVGTQFIDQDEPDISSYYRTDGSGTGSES